MSTEKDMEFLGSVAGKLKGVAKLALQEIKPQANAVIRGRINNENEIDFMLDQMLSFCYDNEMLQLYKAVLRSIIAKYPRVVHSHVYAYYEMFDPEKIGLKDDLEDDE